MKNNWKDKLGNWADDNQWPFEEKEHVESFIESLLAEQKKELVNEAIETLTVDISKDKFINDGFNRWHIFQSRGLEPCPECENGANIRKFIKSLKHHD